MPLAEILPGDEILEHREKPVEHVLIDRHAAAQSLPARADAVAADHVADVVRDQVGHDRNEARVVLNKFLATTLTQLAYDGRHAAATLIAETVRVWDATTITERLERAVGRDLQYIRINGTLIGGLIGIVLYAGAQYL